MFVCAVPLFAQQQGDTVTLDQYKKLQKLRSERASLARVLGAMNVVDSAYLVHYPRWIINDDDLRERVYKTFRNRLKFPSHDSDLVVITTPERDDIIRLEMGDATLGREETRLYIGDNLRHSILAHDYPHTDIEDKVVSRKRPSILSDVADVSFEGSLFGAKLQYSSGWGLEGRIGNEALGFPFWSSGTVEALLIIDRLKVGAIIPLASGLASTDVGPFTLQGRKLNGAPGFALDYQHMISGGTFDLHFISCSLSKIDSSTSITDRADLYYIHSMAQATYASRLAAIENEHYFTLTLGIGYDQIGHGAIDSTNELNTFEKFNHISPVVRIDYQHIGSRTYGFGIQTYNSTALINGWIEMVKNFIYIDIKYSTPILRDPNPWENSYFIMVSPRIRLAF